MCHELRLFRHGDTFNAKLTPAWIRARVIDGRWLSMLSGQAREASPA
jgi:hypothetical protein